MSDRSSSRFTLPSGRRAKWWLFVVWVVAIIALAGPAQLTTKFDDALDDEQSSYLPGDAEATKALDATEQLQNGQLAPAVIVFRRASGLTAADHAKIAADIGKLTRKRYRDVAVDGARAAAGGRSGGSRLAKAPAKLPPGCATPTQAAPGQPANYKPFVGPVCSRDGKAVILTSYIKGSGEGDSLLAAVDGWRAAVSNPGAGLEVKVTGGAGYSADAIKVFEGINGKLLGAALLLVILLLILIYRSPIFLFIPLAAVVFAEILSRSLGYAITELGFVVNTQSSSIMSVLVLGAGTDYALLLVARYREELHRHADRHAAMAIALKSAGPAIFASAATVIAALLCLTIAKVNGTAGLGPIGALGVFCAALSSLTLLPALLTVFGRRAFWPFVPHAPETAPAASTISDKARASFVDGSEAGALARVIPSALLVAVLLPLSLLCTLVHRASGRRVPSLVVGTLDRFVFKPYEVRRVLHEHTADATHGFWSRVGERVAVRPGRVLVGTGVVLLVCCAGLGFFSTDLTTNDGYRTKVESVEGQDLLAKSFPGGSAAPTDVIVRNAADAGKVQRALMAAPGVGASTEVARGKGGVLLQATLDKSPYSTQAFSLIGPIRDVVHRAAPGTLVGGPTAIEADVREASSWDSKVIPPIVLVVVLLILVLLLRSLVGPLILVGTVIVSFLAALGVGYFAFDVLFGFAGSDPSLPLFAFVFLVALGVDYNIFLIARAREETIEHGSRAGILRALAVTGAVITSAGIVLAGTFSVLAVLPLVFLTELGFVVAFGVLLDTFLVRSVLVPAAALVLGPKFWWPSALARAEKDAATKSQS